MKQRLLREDPVLEGAGWAASRHVRQSFTAVLRVGRAFPDNVRRLRYDVAPATGVLVRIIFKYLMTRSLQHERVGGRMLQNSLGLASQSGRL